MHTLKTTGSVNTSAKGEYSSRSQGCRIDMVTRLEIVPGREHGSLLTIMATVLVTLVLSTSPAFVSRVQAQPDSKSDSLADDTWNVIYLGDQRIGYSRSTTRVSERRGQTIVHCVSEDHMTFKRFGQETKMQTVLKTEETLDGDLLRFEFDVHNPPAGSTHTEGVVDGPRLHLTSKTGGRVRRRQVPYTRGLKSPAYEKRVLQNPPLQPGETRTFLMYVPMLEKETTAKATATEYRNVRLLDGKERRLLQVSMSQTVTPTLNVRAYLDESGREIKTETDLLGQTMATYRVPSSVALEELAGAELDISVNTLVRVKSIRRPHQTRRAVYRITTPGDDPSRYLVTGETQAVKEIGPETAELTVTTIRPKEFAAVVSTDPEYLADSRFLQCNDAAVIEHARRAAAGEADPARMVLRMEKYVHEKLKRKNFSTAMASAAEVARNLEGDCTEHAVLLAAMLRARQIPSRIAVGLVYIEGGNSFGGHMWTEAFVGGHWVPLDATLGQGGIGAAHIKLGESGFADEGLAPAAVFLPHLNILGTLQIAVMKTE